MAAKLAFLKEIAMQNKPSRPGVVKVVRHVHGPLEDGSVMKEVADSKVYIKAIFTPESLNTFSRDFEDSFNSPPDLSQALLLLNQFHVDFQPSFAPENTEKRPRFVVVVQQFTVYNLHEGFYSKNQPQNIMEDSAVQAKAEEMEKCQIADNQQNMDVNSQHFDDVPLSMLMDVMGQADKSQSQCVQECADPKAPEGEDGATVTVISTRQSLLEKMLCLNAEDFVVSSKQQALLDVIPEWKDGYIPPASRSSEDQQSSIALGDSLAPLLEGPTLRSEENQALSCTSPKTTQRGTTGQEGKMSRCGFSQGGEMLTEKSKTAKTTGESLSSGEKEERLPSRTARQRQSARKRRERETAGVTKERQLSSKTAGEHQLAITKERQLSSRTAGEHQLAITKERQLARAVGENRTVRETGERHSVRETRKRQSVIGTGERQSLGETGERHSARETRERQSAKVTGENQLAITGRRQPAKTTGEGKSVGNTGQKHLTEVPEKRLSATAVNKTGYSTGTVVAADKNNQVIIVEDSVDAEDDAETRKQLPDGEDPGTCASSSQHGHSIHEPSVDSSGTSQASEDSSGNHPDVSFTISSPSSLENTSTPMDENPTPRSVCSISQPAETVPSICGTEDGNAVCEHQWQQTQNKINASSPPIDKTRHVLDETGNASDSACQSTSANSANAACYDDSDTVSDGETVRKADSESVGILGHAERTEGGSSSKVTLEKEESSSVEKMGKAQSFKVPPLVVRASVEETERSPDKELTYSSPFGIHASERFVPSDLVIQDLVPASQGFVPSDLATQDLVPAESFVLEDKHRHTVCVRDSAQGTQNIIPSNILAQDFVPVKSSDAREGFLQEISRGKQVVTDTLRSAIGQVKTQHRDSPSGQNRMTGENGRNKIMLAAITAHQASIAQTEREVHQGVSCHSGQQADTRNNQGSICSGTDVIEESPEHCVYHSTQNSSTDNSQSPSMLDISIHKHSDCLEKRYCISVLESDETEHLRLTDFHKTNARTEMHQNAKFAAESNSVRNETFTISSPPAKVSKHSNICQKSATNAETSKIFVAYSGCSDSEDDFDRELRKQTSGRGMNTGHTEGQPGCSNETMVIPDSSQENQDIIVISSSEGGLEETCDKSSDLTVEPVVDNRKKGCDPTSRNSASSHKTGPADKVVSYQSGSGGYSDVEIGPNQIQLKEVGKDLCTCTDTKKTKSSNHILRSVTKKSCLEQENDKSRRYKGISRNRQIQDPGQKDFSLISIEPQAVENPYIPADRSSDSDKSEDEPNVQNSFISPTRKRVISDKPEDEPNVHNTLVSPARRRVISPQYEDFFLCRKRPKLKERTDTMSDLYEDRSVPPQLNSVLQSSRTGNTNNNEHRTLSDHGIQCSSEYVRPRQTEHPSCNLKQMTLDSDGRLQSVRTKYGENNAGKNTSHSKEICSHSREAEGRTQDMWLSTKSLLSSCRNTQQQSVCRIAGRTSAKMLQLETRSGPQRSSHTARVHNTQRQTTSSKHSRKQDGHIPRQAQEKPSVPETGSIHTANKTKHTVGPSFSETGSSSDEFFATEAPTNRSRVTVSKKRPKYSANINTRKRSSRERSVNYSSEDDPISEHNKGYVEQSPNTSKVKQYGRSETVRHGGFDRKGQDASTSANHSSNRKAGSSDAQSVQNTHQLQRDRTLRNSSSENSLVRQQFSDSETDQEMVSEMVCDRADLDKRMKSTINAWLEFRARSEDPKQKRLRQLKLAEEVVKKIEDCLSKPCT